MKIAAVQMDVTILEKQHNLGRILERIEEAVRAGAKVVIFPECALTGYCFDSRDEAWPLAETVPGPSTEQIASLVARLAADGCPSLVIVGMLECDKDAIYNAAAVIGPQGILGTHRKVHLLHLGIDRFDVPGDKPFPVFEARLANESVRIGVNICFDCSFPESGRIVKLNGAQLLAIPTNWPLAADAYLHTPNVRATENHLVVVAADRVGEERGFRFAGRSQIVNFDGKVLAQAGESEETILYAEVDLAAVDHNRVVRVPGIYEFDRIAARRPELYAAITKPPK
jgi:predicted amidohydrolase